MSERRPSIGRIVLFKSKDPVQLGNCAQGVPAIIVRVWSDTCVNLQVFRDCLPPLSVVSCSLSEEFETSGQRNGWRWPVRVG